MLSEGFAQIDPNQASTSQKEKIPKENLNEEPSVVSIKKSGRPATSQSQQKLNKCQFCDESNPAFAEGEAMDLHFWKDCPMLTECQYCNQVIEIETLNQHLLHECEKHLDFKECPRCRESIHISTFDRHSSEKACLISKPAKAANRCPMCHQDITPAGD
jgi:centrosomal protein CEP104